MVAMMALAAYSSLGVFAAACIGAFLITKPKDCTL